MKIRAILFLLTVVCLAAGCAGVSAHRADARQGHLLNTDEDESIKDAASALSAVAGSVSNKDLSDEQLYQAAKDLRNDPEAQSAVEAISSAFDGDIQVKYSPATGKRYSADMEYDPETGVRLLPVE